MCDEIGKVVHSDIKVSLNMDCSLITFEHIEFFPCFPYLLLLQDMCVLSMHCAEHEVSKGR